MTPDRRTELAEERTRLAKERTIMANFRTAITVLLFGITFIGLSDRGGDFFTISGIVAIISGLVFLVLCIVQRIRLLQK